MLKAVVLAAAVATALVGYFALSVYILPHSYQASLVLRKAEPIVTQVNLPPRITLGQSFTIIVNATNVGDEADVQTVSIGFPNFTGTRNIKVASQNFRQTPILISKGTTIGSEYVGTEKPVSAQYAIVEAMSRPWASGNSYSITLQVTPETEGRFIVLVKSVALPHSGNQEHWPQEGMVDQQKELANVYSVDVAKA